MRSRRRSFVAPVALASLLAVLVLGCSSGDGGAGPSGAPADGAAASCVATPTSDLSPEGEQVASIVTEAAEELGLAGVVARVTRGPDEVATVTVGEAMPGVPVSADVQFHNGAVVFSYLGTILGQLVEEGAAGLDDPLARWMPEVPYADQITLRQLATTTSGLVDYVPQQAWLDELYDDPFRTWTYEDLAKYVFPEPLLYEPGTNLSYSHMNFYLLGMAIAAITGEPLGDVVQERVLDPLGLDDTHVMDTSEVAEPALHTYTPERGTYEESTYWSGTWAVPPGALLTQDVCDLAASATGIGSGELLSEEMLEVFLDPGTVGLGEQTSGCPSCIPNTAERHFGLGTVVLGDWVVQNPLFTGFSGVQAYLPGEDLAIAVANSYAPGSDVNVNQAMAVFSRLAAALAPGHPLPG